ASSSPRHGNACRDPCRAPSTVWSSSQSECSVPNPDGSSTSSSETRRTWLALALPCVAVLVVFLGALYVYREELAQIGRGNGVAEVGAFRRVRLAAKRPALAPRIVLFADSLAM